MDILEIKNEELNEKYFKVVHPSGLTIYLYPKTGYRSTYAILGTNYGSIDTKFRVKGSNEVIEVPDGIAHYLEHKLFESEEGDAFSEYAKTGAIANAYTSFDFTGYLFSCSENFEESLKILLNFVQSPYFTEETVKKEQGIIGQEIRMYEDNPDWKVLFNLLNCLYHNHPVKKDIAGSIESIAEITAEQLYKCYKCFYNLNNMSICIVGNIDYKSVLNMLDELLKTNKPVEIERIFPDEPYEVVQNRIEQHFEVSVPIFQFGFKEKSTGKRKTSKELAETDILLSIVASKSSPLYKHLLDENLINTSSFHYEYFEGPGYSSVIFSGESSNPDKVSEIIKNYISKIRHDGINKIDFETAKKSIYGKTISIFNSIENIASTISNISFSQNEIFEYIECLKNATIESVTNRLSEQLDCNNTALSIISPINKN